MYSLHCYQNRQYKAMVEEAIKHLPDCVFDHWHIVPIFVISIDDDCDDDEYKFTMNYDDPDDNQLTVQHGHEAFDLAQAFIAGWLLAKGESLS